MDTNETKSESALWTPDPLAFIEKIAPVLLWLGYLGAAWYVWQMWDDLRGYDQDFGAFMGHLIIFGGLALVQTVSWCIGMIIVNQARDIKSLSQRSQRSHDND